MSQASVALTVAKRDTKRNPRSIRREKKIPAVYYGAGVVSTPIEIAYQDFRKAYKVAGESTIIDLTIEGDGSVKKVLVHAVDYDPVSDQFAHVDFINVDMTKPITAHVPLRLTGVAPAIKEHGGILIHNKTEISIRCLPADLPHDIEIDVSSLAAIHASFYVKDIVVDRSKITILDHADVALVGIAAPKTEAELDAELATPVGDTMSEDMRKAAEAEKAAAQASKESDTEKKGGGK